MSKLIVALSVLLIAGCFSHADKNASLVGAGGTTEKHDERGADIVGSGSMTVPADSAAK